MNFPSINIQGNIISSEIIEKIRNEDIKYQQTGDFKLDKKNSVRDEIGFAWAAVRAHWTAFKIRAERLAEGESGVTSTRNSWMAPFFQELGYTLLFKPSAEVINLKSYHISHRASNLNDFPIHIMGIKDDLDKRRENGGPRLSPHALMQEFLNNTEHTYALVSNGRYLRLLRDATRLVRLSYLEFDLEKMMEEELYADFAILFRLLHATRMPQHPDNLEESFIEYYHQESLASGSRIREKLSVAVESSIKILANGFLSHPANVELREAIQKNAVTSDGYYLIQLRLIYRFLFLIVTEERNLVYLETKDPEIQRKRKIYYDYYSIERLRKLATRLHFVDGRKHDLWEGLKCNFLLFERSNVGEKLGIKPLGSGLFGPNALGMLPELKLHNETLLKVIRHLTLFENDQRNWVRVNYSDLDVEEFGSVYEGLLEFSPSISPDNVFHFKERPGGREFQSHYTPEELVKPLIKHSLEHIIEAKLKEKNKEEALLSIKVCDVACGSGHILLSAARKIATELACIRESIDSKADIQQPSPKYFRKAIRDVIKHCIYGVDKNPLAVELCKVALWLEAHNPGEPLGFLDHHIKCGDAIVGLAHREELEKGIAEEAFKTLPGDDKDIASSYSKQNKSERKERETTGTQLKAEFDASVQGNVQEAMEEYGEFIKLPERTPEEIEAKQRSYSKFLNGKGYTFLKTMADTQVAQFFIAKTTANKDRLVTDAEFRQILRGYKSWQSPKTSYAIAVAQNQRFFHWFIEFPEVFQSGGFSCVLGNPPFLGGKRISGSIGDNFLHYIKDYFPPSKGSVDLVGYFVRRDFQIIQQRGYLGLISTNTISQGDTRESSLEYILSDSGIILFAISSQRWPGKANVFVSLFTIGKNIKPIDFFLNGKSVKEISSYLDSTITISPSVLFQNKGKSFMGSIPLGMGFVMDKAEAQRLVTSNSSNNDVLQPYLNGEEFNNSYNQTASRWIINFYDWPLKRKSVKFEDDNTSEASEAHIESDEYKGPVASDYPEILKRVIDTVKPERDKQKDKGYREKWWQYGRRGVDLYDSIKKLDRIIAVARTSKTLAFAFIDPNQVLNANLTIIAENRDEIFSCLQSSFHSVWSWKYATKLKADLIYQPTDCFETFPFPKFSSVKVGKIGGEYHDLRQKLMDSLKLGLTKTYNLFHLQNLTRVDIAKQSKQPHELIENAHKNILKLREMHVQMDQAVLEAYTWQDIQLRHDFYDLEYLPENDRVRYTIHPDARKEILKRLLELNHKIHEEELKSGLWDKKKTGKERKKNVVEDPRAGYGGLFDH